MATSPCRRSTRVRLRRTRSLRAWPSAALKRPTWVTRRLPPSGRSTRNAARAWRTPPATGGDRRDGQIVNLGTWMIGGPSFDGGSVGRYATGYDPRTDPNREQGLRLASDDLYDCGWEATEVFRVPKNAKSGIYAAWFGFVLEGVPHQYPVTFVVTKAKGAPKAPLALMCSSTTWRTYGGTPFAKNVRTKPATGSPAGRPMIRQIRRRTVFIGITRTASPLINLGCVCLGQWPGRAL
jgi:hypothetical protein